MKHLFLLITAITLLNCSCSDKGTNPKDEPDTTSHNFTWEIFEFPTEQIQSNIFWDIFAESDSNVWAVGQVYVDSLDSSGSYIEPYNAAHWDGDNWSLKRLSRDKQPTVIQIYGIWYFGDDNMWLTAGSIYHYDGEKVVLSYLRNINTNEVAQHIWAAAEDDIYAVGTDGLIVHYDGSSWSKMQSGTTMDFQDIWGTVDEETGNVEVWTVGYDASEYIGIILKYNGSFWQTVFDAQNSVYEDGNDHKRPIAIWGSNDSVYIALDGFETSIISRHSRNEFSQYDFVLEEEQGAIIGFSGISKNDFFAVGYRDLVLHYNGSSFRKYFDWIYIDGRYHGVQQIGDKVFICGNIFTSSSAILLYGKR